MKLCYFLSLFVFFPISKEMHWEGGAKSFFFLLNFAKSAKKGGLFLYTESLSLSLFLYNS